MSFSWKLVALIALISASIIGQGFEDDANSLTPILECGDANYTEGCCQSPDKTWYCRAGCGYCENGACQYVTKRCSEDKCKPYYIPPNCNKDLKLPKIVWHDTGALYFTMKLDDERGKYINFEILEVSGDITEENGKWTQLNIKAEGELPYWRFIDTSVPPQLEPNKHYSIRAVLENTTGPILRFNTSWWRPSVPQDLVVVHFNNGATKLKWKYVRKYWERTDWFVVRIEPLGPGSQDNSTQESSKPERHPFVMGKTEYSRTINVTRGMNYTLSVNVCDKRVGNGRAVFAWYFILDTNTLESLRRIPNNTERLPGNTTTSLISWTIPSFGNKNGHNTINVIMNGSSVCPTLKGLPKSDSGEKLMTNEYPACPLIPNKTYEFLVIIDKSPISPLIWLVVLPIFVLSSLLSYFLYRKCKGIPVFGSLTLPYRRNACVIDLSQLTKSEESPFDSCGSLEVQKLKQFENYVRKAAEDGILQQQFMSLPRGLKRSYKNGKLPKNRPKNRYGNLIAYDETRVVLARDLDCQYSDYINASYVQGYCKERAYIATQAPLPETVVDFWRMIWQEEVRIICMLLDLGECGQNMCERYWPEVGEEMTYGDVIVLTMTQRVSTDFTYRSFTVTKRGAKHSQTVQHLQYTGWPDEGVPMYSHSVVEYIHKLLSLAPGQGPIVVHCDTGTGRTGAIILCDICLRHLSAEGTVDVFSEAKTMYSARANMLTNFAQYVLAHLVPTQCLLSIPSKVLCADLTKAKIEEMKKDLPAHIKRLEQTSWMDKAMRPLQPIRPQAQENIGKNRFPKLMPVGDSLVTLSRYPSYDTNSDYISAVSVDGAKIRKQYLASQLPMPSTLTDFWRLIVEKNIELIIILQRPDLEDDTCCDVIPRGTLIPLPYLKVETKASKTSSNGITTDQLLLTDTSQETGRSRNITALICNDWGLDQITRPPPPETLVDIWVASEGIQRPQGQTLVVCYDGVTGCGLYLALSFMLDRMAVEQECDVILAVRAVRRSRPEFVTSQWQFEYLYDAALKYVDSFETYANFTRSGESSRQIEQWP